MNLARCEDSSSDENLVTAAANVSSLLAQTSSRRDLDRIIPKAEAAIVRKHGLQAARVPRTFGGPEVSFPDFAEIMFFLGAGDPNVAQSLQPHFVLLEWIREHGSNAQREAIYEKVLAGGIITNAIAERNTKTPGDFAATIVADKDGYRLDCTKFYCTGSLIADGFYALVNTEDGEMALAITSTDTPGVEIVDDWDGMGQRTTGSGTVRFNNVKLAEADVIKLINWGKQRTHIGAAAQLAHAAIDAGIAQAALADAIEYARTKARPVYESGVDRATDDNYVLHSVGEMSVLVNSARATLTRAANILDHAVNPDARQDRNQLYIDASIAVAEAKAASNETSLRVTEMLYRVAGASSTLRKYNFDRHWRNARTHTTHDPVAYKYRAIGDYLLNKTAPPISTKI